MEIPDQALIPGIYLAIFSLCICTFFPFSWSDELYTFRLEETSLLKSSALGAWVLYSFFYLQILIPGGIYAIKKGNIRLL